MTEAQADKHRTIPGPHPLFGPYSAAFSFFNDPIGYLDKLFKGYGNLVWVKRLPWHFLPHPVILEAFSLRPGFDPAGSDGA